MPRTLDHRQALYFRDSFRAARSTANKDAEGYAEVIVCVERLGGYLTSGKKGLYRQLGELAKLASRSPLANGHSEDQFHSSFENLFEVVRLGRNDSAHEGASARHLTTNAIILALIMEDALVSGGTVVSDYMVRDPVLAYDWEPVSLVRQKMLANSFSYLPIRHMIDEESVWSLVSDGGLARYLRLADEKGLSEKQRAQRLATSLSEAADTQKLELHEALCLEPATPLHKAAARLDHRPGLVVSNQDPARLLGIITAFDLL